MELFWGPRLLEGCPCLGGKGPVRSIGTELNSSVPREQLESKTLPSLHDNSLRYEASGTGSSHDGLGRCWGHGWRAWKTRERKKREKRHSLAQTNQMNLCTVHTAYQKHKAILTVDWPSYFQDISDSANDITPNQSFLKRANSEWQKRQKHVLTEESGLILNSVSRTHMEDYQLTRLIFCIHFM